MPVRAWPQSGPERDRWILSLRGARHPVDPYKAYASLVEYEPYASHAWAQVFTVFLTNRECPWRCVMCDLWRHTLTNSTPVGAIPAQLDEVIPRLSRSVQSGKSADEASKYAVGNRRHLKLYNAGSFFDPRAIPVEDYPAILQHMSGFDRVIIECHPSLAVKDSRVVQFRSQLETLEGEGAEKIKSRELEVAMGLETAHPEVLQALNKRMTVETFQQAARCLKEQHIRVRTFLLVHPPFMAESEAESWVRRSIDIAFEAGSDVVSLIPSRAGNGAMDQLVVSGEFREPALGQLESALEYGLSLKQGFVFADVWDLDRFSRCPRCFEARRERLNRMNGEQAVLPPIACRHCENQRDEVRK